MELNKDEIFMDSAEDVKDIITMMKRCTTYIENLKGYMSGCTSYLESLENVLRVLSKMETK